MINLDINGENYKLKLTTKGAVSIEQRIGKNPLAVFNDDLPLMSDLFVIFHEAVNVLQHGIKLEKVYELYDQYLEEGHSYKDFILLIMQILQDGGYIPKEVDVDELGNQ